MATSIDQFLAAWQSPGGEPDPTTLTGLSRVLEFILEDPDNEALAEELNRGVEHLTNSVSTAIWDTQVEVARLPEHSSLLRIYDLQLSAYDEIEEILNEINEPREYDLEDAKDALDSTISDLKTSQYLWQKWLNDPSPRCSRCGYHGGLGMECPDCDTDLLYPDRRAREELYSGQAVLGAEYKQAYDTYRSLGDGAAKLQNLVLCLEPIRTKAAQWGGMLKGIDSTLLEEDVRQELNAAAKATIQGLDLISQAQETREWTDINDGWNKIFKAAKSIQLALPSLYRALGSEREAAELEQDFRTRDLAGS